MFLRTKYVVLTGSLLFLQCVVVVAFIKWQIRPEIPQGAPPGEEAQALRVYATIEELVSQSDLIVRGSVVEAASYWNDDKSAILTKNIIQTRYLISGEGAATFEVHTEGGFTDEGIGMKSSDSPLFTVGEEVVVFLKQGDVHYSVAYGELGYYLVSGDDVLNALLRVAKPLNEFYRDLEAALGDQNRSHRIPDDWEAREDEVPPVAYDGYDGQGFVYKNRKWGGTCPEVKYKININTAQADRENGSVADFRNAIIAASNEWNAIETADFRLTYDGVTDSTSTGFNGVNEVIFSPEGTSKPTGLARFWFTSDFTIVEADIWFNDDFTWDATSDPSFDEVDLQSVALHEFGHWLALGHDDAADAIMYPTLTMGMLKRELHQNEIDGITYIYPRPTDSTCAQAVIPTKTPTATATPTSINVATPTATAFAEEPPTPSPRLSINYTDGAPGSFFTIAGSGYETNRQSQLLLNDEALLDIRPGSNGEFVIIISTAGAAPGSYTIQVPTFPAGRWQPTGSPIEKSDPRKIDNQSVSMLLDPAKPLRPKQIPERSPEINSVEVSLTEGDMEIFLPLVN